MVSNVIRLESGANTSLTANSPLLTEVIVGFGWKVIPSNSPLPELVPSAIMCDANGVAVSDEHMLFFNQLATTDNSVRYVTKGDQEQIEISLNKIPSDVKKIVLVVYIDPDIRKPGNFSSVRDAYIRVADREDNDIVRYDLPAQQSEITALVFGEIYEHNGSWKFRAVGQGYKTGILGVAKDFKVAL